MTQKIQLEQFLTKIEFNYDNITSRLDGIFGSSEYAKILSIGIDITTPLKLFEEGFNKSIVGLRKGEIHFNIENEKYQDKSRVDLFISACNGLYDIGCDLGTRLQPYRFSDLLIDGTLEAIMYNLLVYIKGEETADNFREVHYKKLKYLFN